jgi:hypothetical protein
MLEREKTPLQYNRNVDGEGIKRSRDNSLTKKGKLKIPVSSRFLNFKVRVAREFLWGWEKFMKYMFDIQKINNPNLTCYDNMNFTEKDLTIFHVFKKCDTDVTGR